MASRKRSDPKLDALRQRGTLNPRPEDVSDEVFRESDFFDARDLLQVKYEMLRRVRLDGAPVTGAAETFGFSRPSFYEAQAAFLREGLGGLLPRKRGPHGGHKLTQEVMGFLDEVRAAQPAITATALLGLVKKRFGVDVHLRTLQRALKPQEKKRP